MAEEKSVARKIQDQRTRVQKKAAIHKKNSQDRASELSGIKAAFQAEKDGIVVQDVLKKARSFAQYHLKIAQDGLGARKTGYKLQDGSDEVENIYLTNDQRAAHLDKASGLQELIDYIERQIKVDLPEPNPEAQQEVDDAKAEEADKGEDQEKAE